MPVARAASSAPGGARPAAQGPGLKALHLPASRHYAFEGQCFVAVAGAVLSRRFGHGVETDGFFAAYAGANAGGALTGPLSHVVFEANDNLTEEVPGIAPAAPEVSSTERNLYEWADGELRLVNVLWAEETTGAKGRIIARHPEGSRTRPEVEVWSEKADGTKTIVGTASALEL